MAAWMWELRKRGVWRGTRGTGYYTVTYSPRGKQWFAAFSPWLGPSQTFKAFATRQEAQRWIEETF